MTLFDDQDVDWTDYDQLKAAAKEMGRSVEVLTALKARSFEGARGQS